MYKNDKNIKNKLFKVIKNAINNVVHQSEIQELKLVHQVPMMMTEIKEIEINQAQYPGQTAI